MKRSNGEAIDRCGSSWRCVLVVLILGSVAGCAARDRPQPGPTPRIPAEVVQEREFLVSPHLGYPLVPDRAVASRVDAAWEALLAGETAAAAGLISEVLEHAPDYAPALVVEAQRRLVAREYASALDLLIPITTRHPRYTAAQLLRGRVLERLGRIPSAYGVYRALAEVSDIAARSAVELQPRAIEIVERRLEDALRSRRFEDAEEALSRLQEWAPESVATWRAAARLAAAADAPTRELEAVRRLRQLGVDEPTVLERLAELELEVGDADRALEIYRALVRRHPGDERLRTRLERAEFLWRLRALPEKVQEKARSVELDRADFATLLYWLLPSVRAANPSAGRVATDILDHPDRKEIVRTVNLGLLEIDPALHVFRPDRPIQRADALRSLLALMSWSSPRPTCLDGISLRGRLSTSRICELAARCGLIPEPGDCLAGVGVAGSEAIEWIREAASLTRQR